MTRLDEFGEGRHHDLIVLGTARGKRVLVAIEAKNDEELGPQIGRYMAKAESENASRLAHGKTRLSRVPDRVANLTRLIFGDRSVDLTDSRYQLLHGLGGTLIEAAQREAHVAVFLVHAFASRSSDLNKVERNERGILRFADLLQSNGGHQVRDGRLLGPVPAGGNGIVPAGFPFYFGTVRYRLRGRGGRAREIDKRF